MAKEYAGECHECSLPIESDPDDLVPDLTHDGEDRPYHWSCLQERYERERIADGEDY